MRCTFGLTLPQSCILKDHKPSWGNSPRIRQSSFGYATVSQSCMHVLTAAWKQTITVGLCDGRNRLAKPNPMLGLRLKPSKAVSWGWDIKDVTNVTLEAKWGSYMEDGHTVPGFQSLRRSRENDQKVSSHEAHSVATLQFASSDSRVGCLLMEYVYLEPKPQLVLRYYHILPSSLCLKLIIVILRLLAFN